MKIASRTGAVVQSDADPGAEGTYQVMFDGEDLPQRVTEASLERASWTVTAIALFRSQTALPSA